MFKLLIVLTFLYGFNITEINSKSCTNLPYNNVPYCEKLTEIMIGYECVDNKCRKTILSCSDVCLTSLNVCKLTCGKTAIWPLPTGDTCISDTLTSFRPSEKNFNTTFILPPGSKNCPKFIALVKGLGEQIKHHVLSYRLPSTDERKVIIQIEVEDTSVEFTDNTTESYILHVSGYPENINAKIVGKTFFGVRHGMETLLQLIVYDEKSKSLITAMESTINDKPDYSYRGLMLDTGRNYYPIKDIKRTLDAMAMNKLNTFHWHMLDGNSFPYVSRKYPQMAARAAYSKEKVYTRSAITEVVEYARSRGIRVIPEMMGPTKLGHAWDSFIDKITKHKYVLSCKYLDLTIEGVYDVLGNLYKEFSKLFDVDMFHMGSEEYNPNCWNTATHIQEWKTSKKVDNLWAYFQNKSLQKLQESNSKVNRVIVWTSPEKPISLTEMPPSDFIAQYNWAAGKAYIEQLLTNGYTFIVSQKDPHYLDCGLSSWKSPDRAHCDPYKTWYQLYMANPVDVIGDFIGMEPKNRTFRNQILGSEGILWSDMADPQVLDLRLWPRAAALAERLWSNPKTGWREAKSRLSYHRHRMVAKGIAADALEPKWCLQNDGECVEPAT